MKKVNLLFPEKFLYFFVFNNLCLVEQKKILIQLMQIFYLSLNVNQIINHISVTNNKV